MHISSNFRHTWWIRALNTYNKEQRRCPEGFSEEMNTVFRRKMLQTDVNGQKIQTFPNFYVFLQILSIFR